jgi:hypothetical protein
MCFYDYICCSFLYLTIFYDQFSVLDLLQNLRDYLTKDLVNEKLSTTAEQSRLRYATLLSETLQTISSSGGSENGAILPNKAVQKRLEIGEHYVVSGTGINHFGCEGVGHKKLNL